ncbi:MAG: hypothetical protein KatS3mg002_0749 [Candidatus Woesearchaeota archaeon]|nr:MAG: hypothetical protein KatS3mg002_0749 [Candidatus Woesearchaeota archaeon]
MKILLQNIQSGVNINKGYWQIPLFFWKYFLPHSQKSIIKISEYIKYNNIDIAVFTEADAGSIRTNFIDQVSLISRNSGLKNGFFFKTTNILKITNQGNGILTKYRIINNKQYPLPSIGEPRFLCQSTIEIRDETKNKNSKNTLKTKNKINDRIKNNEDLLNVFITHLSISKRNRVKQIEEINNIISKIKGSKILLGDFNISSDDELLPLQNENFKRISFIKTYPSWNPKKCFDNIFLSSNIKKYSISKADILVSDHLGLILDFDIK